MLELAEFWVGGFLTSKADFSFTKFYPLLPKSLFPIKTKTAGMNQMQPSNRDTTRRTWWRKHPMTENWLPWSVCGFIDLWHRSSQTDIPIMGLFLIWTRFSLWKRSLCYLDNRLKTFYKFYVKNHSSIKKKIFDKDSCLDSRF